MIEYIVKVTFLSTKWYLDGKIHREDGPAVENSNGSKFWYINGKHHRTDGPAIEFPSGQKEWWVNDKRHREDGPAVIGVHGNREWWVNGKRHRTDGPATTIEGASGYNRWFLKGIEHTEEEFIRVTTAKKMTFAEVEAALGYKIVIYGAEWLGFDKDN